ncbi:hypothetical protein GOODEAATRI_026910 [Goodea atripinnis]|uniref:Uncharacterized protein n=1 Tax=Goodea atripinnis TaxID=208336 RepID=A0ABV0N4W4_9TELE
MVYILNYIHEVARDERGGGLTGEADGMLIWVHTQRLTWPASSLSAGGFPGALGRCGLGRCCGPPAPVYWACSEASPLVALSSSCVGAFLLKWSTSLGKGLVVFKLPSWFRFTGKALGGNLQLKGIPCHLS